MVTHTFASLAMKTTSAGPLTGRPQRPLRWNLLLVIALAVFPSLCWAATNPDIEIKGVVSGAAKTCVAQTATFTSTLIWPAGNYPKPAGTYLWTTSDATTAEIVGAANGASVVVKGKKVGTATITVKWSAPKFYSPSAPVKLSVVKYSKGYTEENPSGTSGLGDPTPQTTHPADLAFSVEISRQVPGSNPPKFIANNMQLVSDKIPEPEAGWCKMEPGSQDYTAGDISATPRPASVCPECGHNTKQTVTYTPSISAEAPAITIALPTWQNSSAAGPWAQAEWARFLGALTGHENNHSAKFLAHCAAAKALIETFAKTRFVGEDCSSAAAAEQLAGSEYDKAKAALDTALEALATAIAQEQIKYDADTEHGKTEGTKINGDIPLLGAKP